MQSGKFSQGMLPRKIIEVLAHKDVVVSADFLRKSPAWPSKFCMCIVLGKGSLEYCTSLERVAKISHVYPQCIAKSSRSYDQISWKTPLLFCLSRPRGSGSSAWCLKRSFLQRNSIQTRKIPISPALMLEWHFIYFIEDQQNYSEYLLRSNVFYFKHECLLRRTRFAPKLHKTLPFDGDCDFVLTLCAAW
jgi:hypothetical protein